MKHPYFSCIHLFFGGKGGKVYVFPLPSCIIPQIPIFFLCFSQWNNDQMKKPGRTYRRFFLQTAKEFKRQTAWKYGKHFCQYNSKIEKKVEAAVKTEDTNEKL